jgi:hypothetical protein
MSEAQRDKRNLNPHAEARLAMLKWSDEYSQQRGGSMDFWDSLAPHRKRLCVEYVKVIQETKAGGAALLGRERA